MKPATTFLLLISFITMAFQQKPSTAALLDNPFDLQKFKKAKGPSNSGGADAEPYYYKPEGKGVYFRFFMFKPMRGFVYERSEDEKKEIRTDFSPQITTYKPLGKYRDDYFDPTETLIEVIATSNDKDLPELAFVGLDTTIVKIKLGDPDIRKDSCFIYSKGRNALVLNISDGMVGWLKYARTNSTITKNTVPKTLTQKRKL
jgi:hypothetical protein